MADVIARPGANSSRQATLSRPSGRARKSAFFAIVLWPLVLATLSASMASFPTAPGHAQATKPYDTKLMRLSEILGAIHYLRELCGAGDGQLWRDQMSTLIRTEGTTALRKARLTRAFNKGYQSYSRTYKLCTASAKTAVGRFLEEGTELAEELVEKNP